MQCTEAFAATFNHPNVILGAMPRCYEANIAHADELVRVPLPAPPANYHHHKGDPDTPTTRQRRAHKIKRWPPEPIDFTSDGRGVCMEELLLWSKHPNHLPRKMGAAFKRPTSSALMPEFWLLISWPGYPQHTSRVVVSNPGTCGGLAVEIAKAYWNFIMQLPQQEWHGTVDEGPWRIPARHDPRTTTNISWACLATFSTMRLMSLHWVGGNTFQAEVHEVFKQVELPDDFWEYFKRPE